MADSIQLIGIIAGALVAIGAALAWVRNSKDDNTILQKDVKAGNYEAAAARAYSLKQHHKAYELYLLAKQPRRAAEVALEMQRPAKAAELFERVGDLEAAISAYRQAGVTSRVTELEAQLNRPRGSDSPASIKPAATPMTAAMQLVEEFKTAKAAASGEVSPEVRALGERAAKALLGAGDMRRAAEVLEEAGLSDQAVNLYVNLLGEPARAADVLRKKGEHRRAAELYEIAADKQRALAEWIAWAEGTEGTAEPFKYVENVIRLGHEEARTFCETIMFGTPLTSATVAVHSAGAEVYEQIGEVELALAVAQEIYQTEPSDEARTLVQRIQTKLGLGDDVPMPAPKDKSEQETKVDSAAKAGDSDAPKGSKPHSSAPPDDRKLSDVKKTELESMLKEFAEDVAHTSAITAMNHMANTQVRVPITIQGAEGVEITLRLAMDARVARAKEGPPPEALLAAIQHEPVKPDNVERYYEIGLVQIAHGRWDDAANVFAKIEQVAPGFRDAGARLNEVRQWQTAMLADGPQSSLIGGRYKLLGELGRGGMAVVYRAHDESLSREVALKFISEQVEQSAVATRYFEREAKAAAALNHPNIVTIFDYGMHAGRPFIAMELVLGTTAEALMMRTGSLPIVEVLQVGTQVLSALEYSHERKIIHRDIKPANFMCTPVGVTKLMDFGLAKSVERSPSQLAKSTIAAGTPPYMAPEQLAGSNNDPRSDIFAVGVSLYELASGKMPFVGADRSTPPVKLRELNPRVPAALEATIHKAMALRPEKRFTRASDMLHPLRMLLAETSRFLEERGQSLNSLQPGARGTSPDTSPPTMLGKHKSDRASGSPNSRRPSSSTSSTSARPKGTMAGVYFHKPEDKD